MSSKNCRQDSMDERRRRIKLVQITTVPVTLNFFHGQIGYLKSCEFDVKAISSPGSQLREAGRREGIDVYPVNMQRSISPFRDLVSLWHLWRLLRQLRPDIVHSHTPKAILLGTIAARFAKIKVVLLTIHGLRQMTKTGISRRLLDLSTWLSCNLADRVLCVSFSIRDFVIANGLCAAEKTTVLGQGSVMGVEAENVFSPSKLEANVRETVRAEYGIPRDAPIIGFVGRIVVDKGMHELTSAWRSLREKYPDLHMLLVGEFDSTDPLSPEVEKILRSDDRVHLPGHRRDVARQLAAMDVFVMPSYREGFGMTNIEAAAMAIPVVSTRIPGCIDSVQDGVTGTLVSPANAGELEAAIRNYLDDRLLCKKHGKAGRERVLRDFRPDTLQESLREMYIKLAIEKGLELRAVVEKLDKDVV